MTFSGNINSSVTLFIVVPTIYILPEMMRIAFDLTQVRILNREQGGNYDLLFPHVRTNFYLLLLLLLLLTLYLQCWHKNKV